MSSPAEPNTPSDGNVCTGQGEPCSCRSHFQVVRLFDKLLIAAARREEDAQFRGGGAEERSAASSR